LNDEEKQRNQFRDAILYKYNEKFTAMCESPLPVFFPSNYKILINLENNFIIFI